jgi:hypothetical protein
MASMLNLLHEVQTWSVQPCRVRYALRCGVWGFTQNPREPNDTNLLFLGEDFLRQGRGTKAARRRETSGETANDAEWQTAAGRNVSRNIWKVCRIFLGPHAYDSFCMLKRRAVSYLKLKFWWNCCTGLTSTQWAISTSPPPSSLHQRSVYTNYVHNCCLIEWVKKWVFQNK